MIPQDTETLLPKMRPTIRSCCTVAFFALSSALHSTVTACEDIPIHPGCLDQAISASRLPTTLDVGACNKRFADHQVKDFLGLIYYDRPTGSAGELRGGLGYEHVTSGDQVVFRLQDYSGGTGVFSSLLVAKRRQKGETMLLTDLQHVQLGDRCDLGLAWIGKADGGEPVTGISLTPAGLLEVLAAPPGQLPESDRIQRHATYAFGQPLQEQLSACPTCCLGHAGYQLSADGQWQLQYLELDYAEPVADEKTQWLLQQFYQVSETATDDPSVKIADASELGEPRRTLVQAHPQPGDPYRLQFWLRRLGYYWLSPVDGVVGPRSQAALSAYLRHNGEAATDYESLSEEQITSLVLRGMGARHPRLHPVDETGLDESFSRFMERLRTAVAERDTDTVMTLAREDMMLGFGGGGHKDLPQWLSDGSLWQDLERITGLGSVRENENSYCVPYSACVPDDVAKHHDLFATLIVVDPQAALLAEPTPDAKVVRRLDYDILTIDHNSSLDSDDFYPVKHDDGSAGYIAQDHVRWMIGYRLYIYRGPQGWRITHLVSGD